MGLIAFGAGIVLCKNVKLVFADGLTKAELETASKLIFLLSVSMGISFPTSVFTNIITAHEKFVFQKLVNMIRTVANPIIMLPLLIMGVKSVGMVVVSVIITVSADIVFTVYCLVYLKVGFKFKHLDIRLLKEIAVFSFYIAINSIIDQINWNVDKLLLGRFAGTIGVAVYGVASQLNTFYIQFSTSVSSVFTPRIYRLIAEKQKGSAIDDIFSRVGRIQFLILALICTGFIWFGKPFVRFWAGDEYSEAYYITMLLIVPAIVPLIQNIGIEIQRAYNKHKVRSLVYSVMAVGNLLISIPLCKLYGGTGCAIGTAISLILANGFFMNIYYHKALNINIIHFWKEILCMMKGLIVPCIVGIGIAYIDKFDNLGLLLVQIAIYSGIYGLSMWMFGMNEYEKFDTKATL